MPKHNHKSLVEALAAAQAEMNNAPFDSKSNFSKNGKNNYASLSSVRDATVPILANHGIAVIQGEVVAGAQTLLRTSLYFQPETGDQQHLYSDVPLIMDKNNMHGVGSAMTYAKRYGLASICGIASDEDDDATEAVKHEVPKLTRVITEEELSHLTGLCDQYQTDPAKVCENFGVKELAELSVGDFQKTLHVFARKKAAAEGQTGQQG